MAVDRSKLNYFSGDAIDMVVEEGEVTIVNDGDTTGLAAGHQQAKIVQSTSSNAYGRAALVRARWSIDGGSNWQTLDSQLVYTFTQSTESGDPGHPSSTTLKGLDSAISIGCSDSQIVFRTANGKHGNVTGTTNPSYTPTSRTFLIQYAIYERE